MWEEKDRQQQCIQEHLEEIERLKDEVLKIREETNEDITNNIKPFLKDCKDDEERYNIDSVLYISDSMFDIYNYALDALYMSIEYWNDLQKVDLTFMETPKINFGILDNGYDFLEFKKQMSEKIFRNRSKILPHYFVGDLSEEKCERMGVMLYNILSSKWPYHIKTNWCMVDNLTQKFIQRYCAEFRIQTLKTFLRL